MINNDTRETLELAPGALVDCPTCHLPAEITDRFTLGGAPGPVEHVKVVCVRRHWYTLPVDMPALSTSGRSPGGGTGQNVSGGGVQAEGNGRSEGGDDRYREEGDRVGGSHAAA